MADCNSDDVAGKGLKEAAKVPRPVKKMGSDNAARAR